MSLRLIVISCLMLSFLFTIGQNKRDLLRDGNKEYENQNYQKSEEFYRKSLEKDSEYFKAKFNLANSIYKQDKVNETDFSRSMSQYKALKDVALDSNSLAKIYYNLGNVFLNQNNFTEAIEAYKSSLKLNPKDEDARYNLVYAKNQDQQNKENQDQQNKENQDQQNKENQKEMKKEDAEKILELIEDKEKKLQKKKQQLKKKGKRKKIDKDW